MKEEGIAIAAEDERDIERLSVAEGLLDAGVDRVIVVLCLDDGDRDIGLVVENVVSPLPCPTGMEFPSDLNPPIREADFFANLGIDVPTRRHEIGCDELGADVAFA